jgi:hypothetical protein
MHVCRLCPSSQIGCSILRPSRLFGCFHRAPREAVFTSVAGGRHGFGGRDFHSKCNGHANILTMMLDRDWSIFGGVAQVESKQFPFGRLIPLLLIFILSSSDCDSTRSGKPLGGDTPALSSFRQTGIRPVRWKMPSGFEQPAELEPVGGQPLAGLAHVSVDDVQQAPPRARPHQPGSS